MNIYMKRKEFKGYKRNKLNLLKALKKNKIQRTAAWAE